jgi:curved DNA-binding protein CbpA
VSEANHYEALGVPASAPVADIRRAYLAAARRHHPDFHADAEPAVREDHARHMQRVNDAWAVLGDAGARLRYDRSLRSGTGPGEDRRRGPVMPAGKGWTPRRGDDGWQRDFAAWADESDELADDAAPPPRHRGPLAVVPVALFAAAVLAAFLGVVLDARPLLAGALIALVVSAAAFVMLPIYLMSRSRRRPGAQR